ncbi:glycosyltransferase family 4 protein [Coleofasciculus sp. FACHB-SPT9]|uniref:glycosyltransferase family 4 protein n=1 Tax=Coleofasciculus sp. FACHB-SPT9 TaxID=2692791 RepID=UPI001688F1EE|nr:glycosyltransferase family 4 protein [Coleofasciculus sp. FACHB-SPT9]MBD1890126.1 glycosyltransferase family 4 protein [Coleofasciculus sp. FACHB-SPT9]
MKIAYATHYDIFNSRTWPRNLIGHCGTNYYKAKALERQLGSIEYIGPLEEMYSPSLKLLSKAKNRWHKHISKKIYYPWAEPVVNQGYAVQIAQKLSKDSEIILGPDMNLISYLECKQPLVVWTDAPYAGLINFYTNYTNLCRETIQQLTAMDKLTLDKCSLAIFSSDWAAQTVIDTYQVDSSKVKVIPSGANVECDRTLDDIKEIIEARTSDKCKLLFLGVDWFRKGGKIALEVASELNKSGLNVELTIVGCQPFKDSSPPDFVVNLGFISKSTAAGLIKISKLIAESHLLIVPSQAEAYGNVFCEANSYGVPCVSTKVGGIPTVIKDNVNGKLFSRNCNIQEYCAYISDLFNNYGAYKKLALSSFNEYQTRLNWSATAQTAQRLLMDLI